MSLHQMESKCIRLTRGSRIASADVFEVAVDLFLRHHVFSDTKFRLFPFLVKTSQSLPGYELRLLPRQVLFPAPNLELFFVPFLPKRRCIRWESSTNG